MWPIQFYTFVSYQPCVLYQKAFLKRCFCSKFSKFVPHGGKTSPLLHFWWQMLSLIPKQILFPVGHCKRSIVLLSGISAIITWNKKNTSTLFHKSLKCTFIRKKRPLPHYMATNLNHQLLSHPSPVARSNSIGSNLIQFYTLISFKFPHSNSVGHQKRF